MRRKTAEESEAVCLLTVGSNTQAMRAKRILSGFGISAAVRKTERGRSGNGCSFGVSFPCLYQAAVVTALHNAGIPVSEY